MSKTKLVQQVIQRVLSRSLVKRVANQHLKKKGFFAPEQIGQESHGALIHEPDENYMEKNFSGQVFRELSDKQEDGSLNNGVADDGERNPQEGRLGERVAKIYLEKQASNYDNYMNLEHFAESFGLRVDTDLSQEAVVYVPKSKYSKSQVKSLSAKYDVNLREWESLPEYWIVE